MKISDLQQQKILVLGLGREGRAVLDFFQKHDIKDTSVADAKEQKTDYPAFFGEDYLEHIADFDLVIKSPGIPHHIKGLEKAKKISSSTEIFFANCDKTIIGITGSKGKSTTANAIYQLLKADGRQVCLVGNIGNPAIAYLDEDCDFFVLEMSSYQLEKLPYSPQIAVFTSLFPEHLDHHGSLEEYQKAKMNIFAHQSTKDFAVVPAGFEVKTKAQIHQVAKNPLARKTKLIGEHNVANVSLALEVAQILGVKNVQQGLQNIEPLKHRLNLVARKNGVEYWNDAISTNEDSTLVALDYFGAKIGTLFLGGYDKGLTFERLAEKVVELQIPVLILFPDNGEKIWQTIQKHSSEDYQPLVFRAASMREGVQFAAKNTPKNKIALLSTASASFSLWRNFEHQGDDFIAEVNRL